MPATLAINGPDIAGEAIALRLDADDTIIRRRLRQKMEFLTDDCVFETTAGPEPARYVLAVVVVPHVAELVVDVEQSGRGQAFLHAGHSNLSVL